MLILMAAMLAETTPPPGDVVGRMATLYDEVCLQTFPIDEQVDALMARKGATPMPAADVKVSLRDDPGRGWYVKDADRTITVLLELPPFHACSVRGGPPGPHDLSAYRRVTDAFKASHRGFAPQPAMDATIKGIRMHADLDARPLPGGSGEILMVIDQTIVDPKALTPGETATPLRFVHQIRSPQ